MPNFDCIPSIHEGKRPASKSEERTLLRSLVHIASNFDFLFTDFRSVIVSGSSFILAFVLIEQKALSIVLVRGNLGQPQAESEQL